MQDFWNTTGITGNTLKDAHFNADKQNGAILSLFQRNPNVSMSPDRVHELIFDEHTPITSVRRAITTLTEAGLLVKTDKKVMGKFGAMTFTWRLA